MHEDLLSGLHVRAIDEGLPGGQGYERHRAGLAQRQRGRLGGDVVLVDRDVLRERADPQVAGASEDLVAGLEVAHGRADLRHDAGHLVAEHERALIPQQPLELTVADHRVQRVDARGAHLDEHVTGADVGLGYIGGAKTVLAVALDDESLRDRPELGGLPTLHFTLYRGESRHEAPTGPA